MLRGAKMNGISRTIAFLLMGCAMLSFSCTAASVVSFESEKFEDFKKDTLTLGTLPEEFYFTRILTATCVVIVFFKFSQENTFKDTFAKDIVIADDNGNPIYKKDFMKLNSYDSIDTLNDCYYKTYFYEIPNEAFDRNVLKNYRTDFITVYFEVDGKKYLEKLKRVEKKYLVTRT